MSDITVDATVVRRNRTFRLGGGADDNLQRQRYCNRLGRAKFGKITPGNSYLALAYHQVREWVENNRVAPDHIRGWDNSSDLGTKPVEKNVIGRLLRFYIWLEDELPEYIPPVNKKKLKKAADDAAQMIALDINQVTAANVARLRMHM